MADERPVHERLLDLALYVPVGIATAVVEELPSFAEKGRQRLKGQLEIARAIGKFTVAEAQRRVGKATGATARPHAVGDELRETPERAVQPGARGVPREEEDESTSRPGAEAITGETAPDVASLPIPGYDTLAASQVVQRLASLRPDELDAVRRYEESTRGRRTILHRIAQLSSADGRATA